MIDEKDNNNLDSQLQDNTDKESTIEENQSQGENSPIDEQIIEPLPAPIPSLSIS